MSDDKKKPTNVAPLFKGTPLPSDEPKIYEDLVELTGNLHEMAKKGEIDFIGFFSTGEDGYTQSGFAGRSSSPLAVAQGLRFLDQEWQERVVWPAWFGDYDDE